MKLIKVLTGEKDQLLRNIYEIKTDYKGYFGEFAGSIVIQKTDEMGVKYALEHLNEIKPFVNQYYALGFFEEHGKNFNHIPYEIEKINVFYYDEDSKKYQIIIKE